MRRAFLLIAVALCLVSFRANAELATVRQAYPLMSESPLSHALLVDLPSQTILRSGTTVLTRQDIDAELAKIPAGVRPKFTRARLILLERLAVKSLLTQEAAAWARRQGKQPTADSEKMLQMYLQSLVETVEVSDAELAQFHQENQDMVGGLSLEQVKPQLRQYLLDQKRQETIARHVNSLSERAKIELDRAWFQSEYRTLTDNPVDKARLSGQPSLVDFGATGCITCNMMAPLLKSLKQQYQGKANVLFVDVREEQALAARFGIDSIPVQVFFDGKGQEVFRHAGAFSEEELKAQLAKMGVKQ